MRQWRIPEALDPEIGFLRDSWTAEAVIRVENAQCRRCRPTTRLTISNDDEDPDSDFDGLSDPEEDVNGNGR